MRKISGQPASVPSSSTSDTPSSSSAAAAAAAAAASGSASPAASGDAPPSISTPPAATPLSDEAKAKLKASRQLSKQMPVMDLKARLNKDLPKDDETLKDKMARTAGNVGVYAGVAADKTGLAGAGSLLSATAGSLVDKMKHGSAQAADMKRHFTSAVIADFKQAQVETDAELKALNKKAKSELGLEINEKEKLERLTKLKEAFKSEPMAIATAIRDNRDDPAYKIMGPSHFVSMEVSTRQKLAAAGKGNYGLSTMERVAIYGYTTKDFQTINPALRDAKGAPISDPNLRAYANHITNGLSKLPDYVPPADKPALFRGMDGGKMPKFVLDQMKPGGVLMDHAFSSTSTDKVAAQSAGNYQLEITNFAGSGAKLLPFSAFEGEGEVLFPPGTQFELKSLAPYSQKRFLTEIRGAGGGASSAAAAAAPSSDGSPH